MCRNFFVKSQWLFLFLVLFISGCSSHDQLALKQLRSYYAPVQNGRIEYYRFGKGSPIILIAGYATDVSSWSREFLLTLAKHHEVIVFNNRNVGGSLIQSSQYQSQDLANDTFQLIEDLNLKKPAVLGISMGGMIAQQLAATHPGKLGSLILINTAIAGKQAVHPDPNIEKQMLNMPKNKFGRYILAIELFFPSSSRVQMAYKLIVDRFQPGNYKEIDPVAVMSQQRSLVTHWIEDDKTAKKIQQFNLPVLILNGEADVVIHPSNSIILARTITYAHLVRWKQGGHAMIYQYPKQIANTINGFIKLDAVALE